MAILITMIMVVVLVVALVISSTVEKQKHYEAKDCDFSARKENTINNVPEADLDLEADQSSCESGILETHGQLNLPSAVQSELRQNLEELAKTTAAHQSIMTLLPSLSFQTSPLTQQSSRAESEAQILKNGLKIACVVISVSTSGIISFLVGFSGNDNNNNQSSTRIINNKLLFKAVILSMCASLFSALVLLLISTIKLNFSWLILTVRIIIWISTGLLTLGVILLIALYFHVA